MLVKTRLITYLGNCKFKFTCPICLKTLFRDYKNRPDNKRLDETACNALSKMWKNAGTNISCTH